MKQSCKHYAKKRHALLSWSILSNLSRPPVLSMELVSLGRLVLVMRVTLIGYAIGYFQNQDPHGYPCIPI